MKTRWTERVIALHPGIVTGVFLLLFFGGAAAINIFPFGSPPAMAIWTVSMVFMTAPLILWHYSLREVAERKAEDRNGMRPRKPLLFMILVIAFPLFLGVQAIYSVIQPTSESALRLIGITMPVLMLITVVSYFGAIWTAADSLMRFDKGSASVPFHTTIVTFLLEFYLPIGVWFLHPRIRRMLAQ